MGRNGHLQRIDDFVPTAPGRGGSRGRGCLGHDALSGGESRDGHEASFFDGRFFAHGDFHALVREGGG